MPIFDNPFVPAFDASGAIAPGAKLTFRLAGTSTLAPVYTTAALTTALPNPVVANGSGRFPNIFLDPSKAYKVDLTTAANVLISQSELVDGGTSPRVVSVIDKGAPADGSGNATAAFVAAAGTGTFRVPAGRYTIGTSAVLNGRAIVDPGARIVIASGVTLTLSGGVEAADEQIFEIQVASNVSGAVAGLMVAKQAWFDGDLATLPGMAVSATACDVALQNAFNAVASAGILYGDPRVRRKGSTLIGATCNYDGRGVTYLWSSAATNGFNAIASDAKTFFGNFNFAPLVPGTIPTSGTALLAGRAFCTFENINITDAYAGINAAAGVGTYYRNYTVTGTLNIGVQVSTIDAYFQGGIISALNDWMTLNISSGTFNKGDALTIGGSIGNIAEKNDATHFRVFVNDIKPTVGMAVTCPLTGATATVASVTIGHQLGGVRLEPASSDAHLESVVWRDTDVLGGIFSLTVVNAGGGNGRIGHAAFCRFEKTVFFDSPYQGAVIDGAYDCEFDCWFANARAKNASGAYITNATKCRIRGDFTANSGVGLQVSPSNIYTTITGATFNGNCRNNPSPAPAFTADLLIDGNISRLILSDLFLGFPDANGIAPPNSFYLPGGSGDYITATNIQAPVGTGVWNSTGAHNRRIAVSNFSDI